MASRSLRLSPEGSKQAKEAMVFKSLTQSELAERVRLARASVSKFFASKPVDRYTFIEICRVLDLEWDELADVSENTNGDDIKNEFNTLIQKNRGRIKPIIDMYCSSMRVLDMTRPVALIGSRGIYTNVNILEKISARRRLGLTELLQEFDLNTFDRFGLSKITEVRVPGLDAANRYSKLVLLGKPGAGKTTFLKYLAMKCLDGEFKADFVPVFITLRDFAEVSHTKDLLEFITNQYGEELKNIIQHGKALILLDGLDEIRGQDVSRVVNQVRQLSTYFSDNRFIVTCRIAAIEYVFENFVEVEIADFDLSQINTFAVNWFSQKNSSKAKIFTQKLKENRFIQELATNPLLLTLLCLVFEESGDFPANHSELYEEGINILLKKWDGQRNIERDQIYKNLSFRRKEDLLSYIAWKTFTRGDYFFKRRDVERYIAEYLCNLTDSENDIPSLELDSKAVLKSIEAQHSLLVERARDIYSFSHLVFHEYFVARGIIANATFRKPDYDALKALVEHISEPCWREVFILVANMLASADELLLLMKQSVDSSLALDAMLQEFLKEVMLTSGSVHLAIEPVLVRAFLFSLFLGLPFDLLDSFSKDQELPVPLAIATKVNIPEVAHFSSHGYFSENSSPLNTNLKLEDKDTITLNQLLNDSTLVETKLVVLSACETGVFETSSKVEEVLQEFQEGLKDTAGSQELTDTWWDKNGRSLAAKLIPIIGKSRSVRYEQFNDNQNEQFNDNQKKLLRHYYDANKLLVNCLYSDCYVSRVVRKQICDTLLLPIEEIEKQMGSETMKH
jgi:predicted NACHT family NTPase